MVTDDAYLTNSGAGLLPVNSHKTTSSLISPLEKELVVVISLLFSFLIIYTRAHLWQLLQSYVVSVTSDCVQSAVCV